MAKTGAKRILDNARARDVVLLLGEADSNVKHRSLNRSCRGNHQGRHRFERSVMFKAHLDRYFKPHNTRLVPIPGVGHSSSKVFKSEEGRKVVFF